MQPHETLAWFDGSIVPVGEVRVSALSHSLHYGTGVFEGMRAYEQKDGAGGLFRLRDHMERLESSARILGYRLPYDVDALCAATIEVLRANGMTEGYVRPLAWMGEGGMGVAGGDNPVHVMIATWPWGAYLGEEGMRRGIRVVITGFERATGSAFAHRAKVTGQYVTGFMAKRLVKSLAVDEGLLLDRDGYLSEGTGENLFMARRGTLLTAPDESPILHGITRDTVLTLARDRGLPIEMARFSCTDLYDADEAFLTGTAAEVTPIREVDGRELRHSPGAITAELQSSYLALVRGEGERAEEWVTRF